MKQVALQRDEGGRNRQLGHIKALEMEVSVLSQLRWESLQCCVIGVWMSGKCCP